MKLDRGKLIRAREMLGYGIETVAEEAGVSKNSVLRAEHEDDIRPLTARKIAAALGVRVADLIGEGETLKAQPRLPSFNGESGAAEVIADYETLTEGYRMSWRGALESLAAQWEERLRSGAFDRSMVEQFFADVRAISKGVALAAAAAFGESGLRRKYKTPPTAEDVEAMQATSIAPAGARLLELCDEILAAAEQKFSQSELEAVRREREEARRAMEGAA